MVIRATTTASAACDVIDAQMEPKKDVTKLCMFAVESPPAENFSRTSKYAKDPKGYLISVLGEETFKAREHLLCIPEKVERDFYGTGPTKQQFEKHIANVLGKQHGLFFLTGVQAQLAALKIYCSQAGNNTVAWHVSSHLESAEQVAYKELYGLNRVLMGNDANALPTVQDITAVLALPESERPAAVVIEIPNRVLGCETYSFAELETISSACGKAGVKFHCDGARLWEIEPYYKVTAGKSFADIGALFDSVYVSFYKGLGGVTGAMLVHNEESFIEDAKLWQRRAGGNAFQLTYEVVDCQRGYNETIGTFPRKRSKMLEVAEEVMKATAKFKTGDGKPIINFRPNPPNCCQVHTIFQGFTGPALEAARDEVQRKTNIRVFERLRPKQTVDEKMKEERERKQKTQQATSDKSDKEAALSNGSVVNANSDDDKVHFMEWMIMSVTEKIETKVFVEGYVALCQELDSTRSK